MKTHQIHTNVASMWLAESPDEARSQIAILLQRLGDGNYTHLSTNRVPPDTEYDEFPDGDEWIQAGGDQTQGLLVEVKRLDSDGMLRLYVVGRSAASQEAGESAQVRVGEHIMTARKDEVLGLDEAIGIFRHYYDHNTVPDGWNLRLREWYSSQP